MHALYLTAQCHVLLQPMTATATERHQQQQQKLYSNRSGDDTSSDRQRMVASQLNDGDQEPAFGLVRTMYRQ